MIGAGICGDICMPLCTTSLRRLRQFTSTHSVSQKRGFAREAVLCP